MKVKDEADKVLTNAANADALALGAKFTVGMVLTGHGVPPALVLALTALIDGVRPVWMQRPTELTVGIVERLQELEINVEELTKNNEHFASVLALALREAIVTHEKQKIDALRNAVVNTAAGIDIEEQTQLVMLGVLSQLSELHIRALIFLNNPMAYPEPPRPPDEELTYKVGFERAFSHAIPELDYRTSGLYQAVITDLYIKGLSTVNPLMDDGGWQATTLTMDFNRRQVRPLTTWLGGRLIDYIGETVGDRVDENSSNEDEN